ncbi:MAG TPA: nitroreductase [bacterium]|nr:nitroreductase [bacterium]
MNVTDALNSRASIRAFKPDPIARETIRAIMEAATRAPSWANTQPWEIYIAAGEPLERLRRGFLDRFHEGKPRALDMPAPAQWPEASKQRMEALMAGRTRLAAPGTAGKYPRQVMAEWNYRFFGAPVVVYLCMERGLSTWSLFDIGLLAQSIMLAAQEHGVDSIPAVMLASYPDLIRTELGIPQDQLVLFGIALGHRDPQAPQNQLRTTRRPLEDVVRMKGL